MIYLYENQFSYTDNPLPEEWKEHLPKADHMWIYKTPFTQSVYKDYTDLDMSHVNKLRWYPPQPSLRVISIPLSTSFLTRHLLLWMPRKLWNVKLHSKCNDCGKHPVTSAGVYPHVRQVLDGWEVPEDVGHRKQFLSLLPTTTPGT